jgi:hypothetical protein
VFSRENVLRAEVRVRWSYVNYDPIAVALDRRVEDDMIVWNWSTRSSVDADWWEVVLPLMHPNGDRVGSLVMWQDGMASETSLSHVHTIARELRRVVQEKLVALWPSATYAARAMTPVEAHPALRTPPLERAVPVPMTSDVALVAATAPADTVVDQRTSRDPVRRTDSAKSRHTTAA